MENQAYHWFVKNGNILIQKNGDCIALQLDYENGESCLLTQADNEELIQLLSKIAKQIWENPDYERKPYMNQLYEEIDEGYCWEMDTSKLILKQNNIEKAIEIKCSGSNKLNLEINYVVEIIQILKHLN